MNAQEKSIELVNRFPEITHQRREELCAAFSEAIEWGRKKEEAYFGSAIHLTKKEEKTQKRLLPKNRLKKYD